MLHQLEGECADGGLVVVVGNFEGRALDVFHHVVLAGLPLNVASLCGFH